MTRLPASPARRFQRALLSLLVAGAVSACSSEAREPPDAAVEASTSIQQQFLANLAAQCGKAYPGRLVFEPEGDPMLTGTEQLLVHFRDCEPNEVRIPFHVEIEDSGDWDRSRTWYLTLAGESLELRHDHREPDGSESRRTWYGGFSVGEGTATSQDFRSPQRSEVQGVPVGWRVEIEPGVAYRYGTTYDGEFDWLIEFDLSTPVDGEIPAAWGHETPPARSAGPP